MGIFNPNDKSINLKIVYYGPSFGGKTTSLQRVYELLCPQGGSGLISLDTDEDATLFFDYLPINLMILDRYAVRIQGFTVPGQSKYATTRKLVLKGADGVVFVADAQRDRLRDNLLSFAELSANLREHGLSVETLPLALEYNKCDLEDRLPLRDLQAALNQDGKYPAFETIATQSHGVFETFAEVVRRLVARTHQDFDLDRYGIKRHQLAAALDQALAEIRGPSADAAPAKRAEEPAARGPIKVRGESPPGDLVNGTDSCPLDPAQLQEQLLKSAVETNLEFARLFAEQAEYRRGLEQRHATLLETAQMASHDLRKPVAALKNILHILKKEGSLHLKKNLREALCVAVEVTEYMERLIHELLEERMQYFEKPTLQDSVADLAVLMEDVQARLRFLASEKRAMIRCRPLPRMRCDPTSMTSVFMNVVGNAIKYSDPAKPAPCVEVGARVYRKSLLLYIQDNGIGIARSELPRILRKYGRGSNASAVVGTGLGLHIVREIVTDHGGRLRVTSKLGEGTTVLMRFPADRLLDEDRLPETAETGAPAER